jgi:hypothetical protein
VTESFTLMFTALGENAKFTMLTLATAPKAASDQPKVQMAIARRAQRNSCAPGFGSFKFLIMLVCCRWFGYDLSGGSVGILMMGFLQEWLGHTLMGTGLARRRRLGPWTLKRMAGLFLMGLQCGRLSKCRNRLYRAACRVQPGRSLALGGAPACNSSENLVRLAPSFVGFFRQFVQEAEERLALTDKQPIILEKGNGGYCTSLLR